MCPYLTIELFCKIRNALVASYLKLRTIIRYWAVTSKIFLAYQYQYVIQCFLLKKLWLIGTIFILSLTNFLVYANLLYKKQKIVKIDLRLKPLVPLTNHINTSWYTKLLVSSADLQSFAKNRIDERSGIFLVGTCQERVVLDLWGK